MAQSDTLGAIPANPSGFELRTEINEATLALATESAGTAFPSPEYPFQLCRRTDLGILFRRNAADDAWEAIENYAATTDPAATDDLNVGTSWGWKVGAKWINTTSGHTFICASNADGAAVWVKVTEQIPATRQVATGGSLTGGGDLSADRTLQLSGDSSLPGANKVYGTDSSGTKGWKNDPTAPQGAQYQTLFRSSAGSGDLSAVDVNSLLFSEPEQGTLGSGIGAPRLVFAKHIGVGDIRLDRRCGDRMTTLWDGGTPGDIRAEFLAAITEAKDSDKIIRLGDSRQICQIGDYLTLQSNLHIDLGQTIIRAPFVRGGGVNNGLFRCPNTTAKLNNVHIVGGLVKGMENADGSVTTGPDGGIISLFADNSSVRYMEIDGWSTQQLTGVAVRLYGDHCRVEHVSIKNGPAWKGYAAIRILGGYYGLIDHCDVVGGDDGIGVYCSLASAVATAIDQLPIGKYAVSNSKLDSNNARGFALGGLDGNGTSSFNQLATAFVEDFVVQNCRIGCRAAATEGAHARAVDINFDCTNAVIGKRIIFRDCHLFAGGFRVYTGAGKAGKVQYLELDHVTAKASSINGQTMSALRLEGPIDHLVIRNCDFDQKGVAGRYAIDLALGTSADIGRLEMRGTTVTGATELAAFDSSTPVIARGATVTTVTGVNGSPATATPVPSTAIPPWRISNGESIVLRTTGSLLRPVGAASAALTLTLTAGSYSASPTLYVPADDADERAFLMEFRLTRLSATTARVHWMVTPGGAAGTVAGNDYGGLGASGSPAQTLALAASVPWTDGFNVSLAVSLASDTSAATVWTFQGWEIVAG